MSEFISIEDHGHVRHLVLDRPDKRNAINLGMTNELREAASETSDATDVRVVVLRGAGAAFSAGVDVGELSTLGDTAMLRPFRRACIEVANLLEEMPKAVIAQIHGHCIGLGAELALACDMRVMAEGTRFGLPETRLGLIPDVGGSSRLPAVVGLGRAKELIMTGRTIDATECLRIGAANRVVPEEQLERETEALVDELLAAAPLAVGLSKRVLDGVAKPTLAASLEQEITIQQTLVGTEDFREAGMAFIDKREPHWTGAPPGSPEPQREPA